MRQQLSSYFQVLSLVFLGILLVGFPLVFSTLTTDIFTLPKQFVLIGTVLISFVFLGAKFLSEKAVTIRRTPLDLPILVFLLAALLSSVFSLNRAESLVSFVTLLFAASLYFLFTNS